MLTNPRYVRGCAGFAGFARGGDARMLAETFSQEATRLLGAERWARWGSEQVASNMIVANDPNALLLPYDHYFNFWDERSEEHTSELQSLMRISYAVFCLKKNTIHTHTHLYQDT